MIQVTSHTVTVVSLADIMSKVSWTNRNKEDFFNRLNNEHSWGDTDLACISQDQFDAIVTWCELPPVTLLLEEDALIQLDWDDRDFYD